MKEGELGGPIPKSEPPWLQSSGPFSQNFGAEHTFLTAFLARFLILIEAVMISW